MPNELLASRTRLSDAELIACVKTIVARERDATAQLVAHLAELDTRDVHVRAGHSSLFTYCRDALGLSDHEAYNRIEVARVVRRFPEVLELLAEESVNLTTVRLLAPHLFSYAVDVTTTMRRGSTFAATENSFRNGAPRGVQVTRE